METKSMCPEYARKEFPASTLFYEMNKCNETGKHRTAVIVFSSDNWPDENYSELERSYASHSNQWGWNYNLLGRRRSGDCLDGSEKGIRLDHYGWKIEKWYWAD